MLATSADIEPPSLPLLAPHDQETFADGFVRGLSQPSKWLAPRFLYDAQGSALFEAITRLEPYYLTRVETAVLHADAGEIAALLGADVCLIEFGAGSSDKAQILLARMLCPAAYAPIDISPDALQASANGVAKAFPDLEIKAICADFSQALTLPRLPGGRRVGFFPGSTIGNLTPPEACAFLRTWRPALGRGGAMLVGVDLRKPRAVLEAAYDDPEGVTANFTRNVLARANRELGGDFDLAAFGHAARYEEETGRMAIHLVSLRAQTAHAAGHRFVFSEGEAIHVEDSWKYGIEEFQALARRAGYMPGAVWTDARDYFSIHLLAIDG